MKVDANTFNALVNLLMVKLQVEIAEGLGGRNMFGEKGHIVAATLGALVGYLDAHDRTFATIAARSQAAVRNSVRATEGFKANEQSGPIALIGPSFYAIAQGAIEERSILSEENRVNGHLSERLSDMIVHECHELDDAAALKAMCQAISETLVGAMGKFGIQEVTDAFTAQIKRDTETAKNMAERGIFPTPETKQ